MDFSALIKMIMSFPLLRMSTALQTLSYLLIIEHWTKHASLEWNRFGLDVILMCSQTHFTWNLSERVCLCASGNLIYSFCLCVAVPVCTFGFVDEFGCVLSPSLLCNISISSPLRVWQNSALGLPGPELFGGDCLSLLQSHWSLRFCLTCFSLI